jgi:SAM-dependent methyltransferase
LRPQCPIFAAWRSKPVLLRLQNLRLARTAFERISSPEKCRMTKTYADQVQEQIEQYRDTEDMHDLPAVFHLWSSEYLLPGFASVFGVKDINAFYVEAFVTASSRRGASPVFLSIGCGDGSVEIRIARSLLERGMERFRFVCYDLSEILLARFRAAIPAELSEQFDLRSGDLNAQPLEERFDAVMANHSLHHMVDLEGIFSAIYNSLYEDGIFVTADMIGRNGHMRWPEARMFVDFFWPFLRPEQRLNRPLRRLEQVFADHDCSNEGFEGIRAQDVLPTILRQGFQPKKFLACGGVVDVFIDRSFGRNFDVDDPNDVFLVRRIGFLNEVLLDAGLVKPTIMLAWFTKRAGDEVYYRGRSARAALRDTAEDPPWLAGALADFSSLTVAPDFAFRAEALQGLNHAKKESEALQEALTQKAALVAAMERSTSWQLTAPLRSLVRTFRRATGRSR